MNVSAVNNYSSNFSIAKLAAAVKRSSEAAQENSSQSVSRKNKESSGMFGNSDGDTAQVNLLKFMDKVKTGTVTDADLSGMKDKINQMEQKYGTPPTVGRNENGVDMQGFMDKVKAGTVTDSDLATMKESLGKMETKMGQMAMPGMGPMMGGMPPRMGGMPTTDASKSSESVEQSNSKLIQQLLDALEDNDSDSSDSGTTTTSATEELLKYLDEEAKASKDEEGSKSQSQGRSDMKKQMHAVQLQAYLSQTAAQSYGTTQDIKV